MDLRLKWLFRPALSPAQMDEREASCPSELFTSDPFKWDDADPKVQVRPLQPYRRFPRHGFPAAILASKHAQHAVLHAAVGCVQ